MYWVRGVGFVVLCIAMIVGCGKDDKRDQEIQKAMDNAVKKEGKMYEGVQKSIDDLEKNVQEQQKGVKK